MTLVQKPVDKKAKKKALEKKVVLVRITAALLQDHVVHLALNQVDLTLVSIVVLFFDNLFFSKLFTDHIFYLFLQPIMRWLKKKSQCLILDQKYQFQDHLDQKLDVIEIIVILALLEVDVVIVIIFHY